MKLKKLNIKHTDCLLNRLVETGASQVSVFQDCENNTSICFVRFSVSTVLESGGKKVKVGELHIISKKKLARKVVESVVEYFRNQVDYQVNYLFYFDPVLGWEQFDSSTLSSV